MHKSKEEHRRLADFSHLFTHKMLTLAVKSLKNPDIEKPIFMAKLPGTFYRTSKGLLYNDTDGVSRIIIPKENREKFINALWKSPKVPRGQASFQAFIAKRYIGLQTRYIRDFVANQTGLQFVRALKHKIGGRRAIRGTIPFKRISFDLADCISFSEVRGKDQPRFVLIVVDEFSGMIFALLLSDKTGPEVTKKFEKVLQKIRKFGGEPKIGTSDLGLEFLNVHMKALFKTWGIKHLQPQTGTRIAPFAERAVRSWKSYVRILSKLLFKDTAWYEKETIQNACDSVNNIQKKSGFSALEIVQMWRKGTSLDEIRKSQRSGEIKEEKVVGYSDLEKGDFVRIRVAKQKLDLKFKSHLGFEGDYFETPVNWSTDSYRVLDKKRLRVRRTTRFKLNNNLWYNREQLLKIPSAKTFRPEDRMSRVNKQIYRQHTSTANREPKSQHTKISNRKRKKDKRIKLDLDTSNIIGGRRRRKRVNYAE